MSNYKYKCPTEYGYTKIKLTKKQHNEIFKKQKVKWYDKYEYYINDYCVLLHRFYNWKIITLITIFLPVAFLIEGLGNVKETWRDLTRTYKQKQCGAFFTDHYYKEAFEKVKLIENQN